VLELPTHNGRSSNDTDHWTDKVSICVTSLLDSFINFCVNLQSNSAATNEHANNYRWPFESVSAESTAIVESLDCFNAIGSFICDGANLRKRQAATATAARQNGGG